MAIAVEMPKMSDTMEEGVLVAWLAEEGASVSAGDVIAQVETDKATMDLEVYDDGVLLKRVVGEGSAVPIGALIAILGDAGESVDEVVAQYGGGDGAATPAPAAPGHRGASHDAAGDAGRGAGRARRLRRRHGSGRGACRSRSAERLGAERLGQSARVKASPLARRMAEDAGIAAVDASPGADPDGRVVKRDIEAAMSGRASAPARTVHPRSGARTRAPAAARASAAHRTARPTCGSRRCARRSPSASRSPSLPRRTSTSRSRWTWSAPRRCARNSTCSLRRRRWARCRSTTSSPRRAHPPCCGTPT